MNKLLQKDTTVRRTKRIVGYKDHVKADAENKPTDDYRISNTALNDSNSMPEMINEDDKMGFTDST